LRGHFGRVLPIGRIGKKREEEGKRREEKGGRETGVRDKGGEGRGWSPIFNTLIAPLRNKHINRSHTGIRGNCCDNKISEARWLFGDRKPDWW